MKHTTSLSYVRLSLPILWGAGIVYGDVCPAGYSICTKDDLGRRECCDRNGDCWCDDHCDERPRPEGYCSKPWNDKPSDEWLQCRSKCPKRRTRLQYYEDAEMRRCHNYCNFKEKSDLSPASVIIIVLIFAIAFGAMSTVGSRLLEVPKRKVMIPGFVTVAVVLFAGLLPATTQYPMICAEVAWHGEEMGLMIYPIVFLGFAGSFAGLMVAVAWLAAQSRNSLAKVSTVYLFMVTVCNFCGVIGVMHMSCHQEHLFGLSFYVAWLVSSFITNLVLQKIVVMRASLVDESRLPKVLRCLFCCEVIIALMLFGLTMFIAIAASTADYEKREEEYEEKSEQERREDRERGQQILHLIVAIVVLISILFVLLDLFFSFVSSMAMRSGLKKVMSQVPPSNPAQQESESSGLVRFPNALARAMFFAKVNLFLVVASVATTTLFYISFMTVTLVLVGEHSIEEVHRRIGFLFVSWLLDSLFNDICVVFVGFGPTSEALSTIGNAAAADIIGAPTVHMGEPVAGTIVAQGTVITAHTTNPKQGEGDKNAQGTVVTALTNNPQQGEDDKKI